MHKYEYNYDFIAAITKAFSNACHVATVLVQGIAESTF